MGCHNLHLVKLLQLSLQGRTGVLGKLKSLDEMIQLLSGDIILEPMTFMCFESMSVWPTLEIWPVYKFRVAN